MTLGCGSHQAQLGKVRGTVRYNKAPVAAGSLVFEVTGARPGHAKIVDGEIVSAGTYEADDGIAVGQVKIAVFAVRPSGATTTPSAAKRPTTPQEALARGVNYAASSGSMLPKKFCDPATSGLSCKIVPGDNRLTLDLE